MSAVVARWLPICLAALFAPALVPALAAQPGALRVEVGVEPLEVTVGDPFRAVLHVSAAAGVRVEYGEFTGGDTLQALAPVERVLTADGDTAAVYALVAWAAGAPLRASVPVRLVEADGSVRVQDLALRLPEVRSVLADAEEPVEPRPPKGLVGPDEPAAGLPWWWWLALLLAALLAAALAYYLLAKKRPEELPVPVDPRGWALEQLDEAETLLPARRLEELHQRVSWIVRRYVHTTHPHLSPDLTSTEVLATAPRVGLPAEAVERLRSILSAADRVKFARHAPSRSESETLLLAAREWVASYPVEESAADAERRVA